MAIGRRGFIGGAIGLAALGGGAALAYRSGLFSRNAKPATHFTNVKLWDGPIDGVGGVVQYWHYSDSNASASGEPESPYDRGTLKWFVDGDEIEFSDRHKGNAIANKTLDEAVVKEAGTKKTFRQVSVGDTARIEYQHVSGQWFKSEPHDPVEKGIWDAAVNEFEGLQKRYDDLTTRIVTANSKSVHTKYSA